jgi:putative nucleotidyltransferase with HDIG domain
MSASYSGPAQFRLTATEKLNFELIPAWLEEVADQLVRNNCQVFLVGGAVRDLLWGKVPRDWDLATDALPGRIETLFTDAGMRALPTGKQFGTITVLTGENAVEITTMRSESSYSDGRRPDTVKFEQNIGLDLARRDFTINAMAYNFADGMLVDPFKGRRDLYTGVLRAVGDPAERFAEDGLRMFRFYRFLATLDLKPHRSTERAIDPKWAPSLSIERIRDEFGKLLVGRKVRLGLNGLLNSGLLECFLPELNECRRMDQKYRQPPGLWEHIVTTTETIEPRLHLRLAALFHDIAKPITLVCDETGVHFYGHDHQGAEMAGVILERMRFPNKLITKVGNLIRRHMFNIPFEASDGAVRRLIAKVGPEAVPDLLELRRADIVATGRVGYQTYEYWQDLQARVNHILLTESDNPGYRLALNGADLIDRFGLKPGPLIGNLLEYLREIILEDPGLNCKELLFQKAEEYLESQKPGK